MDKCNSVTGCQWSPKMLACKVSALKNGKRRVDVDNIFYAAGQPNIMNVILADKEKSNDVCEIALQNQDDASHEHPLVIYYASAGPLNKCSMTGNATVDANF